MSKHELERQGCEENPLAVGRRRGAMGEQHGRAGLTRWSPAAFVALAIILVAGLPARAQTQPSQGSSTQAASDGSVPCPATGQDLVRVPELISKDGKLRATVILSDEQVRMTFRQPYRLKDGGQVFTKPNNNAVTKCYPQYVRVFRGVGAIPAPPTPAPNTYADPLPGPTLRARVGEFVQLTFINQINPAHFANSIDRGETGENGGCDKTSAGYPGGDTYPDCFHGSSTGNIHFHGTHTNPNTTGDNVFLEVRPSPQEGGKFVVTPESVKKPFEKFFERCEAELGVNVLREWPKTWDDLPDHYTDEQKKLLKEYDRQLEKNYPKTARRLWPVDEAQLKQGAWPQFYIGAFPYCFRLPQYTASTSQPSADHPHMGAGTAEESEPARALMMGQAPGTHWYHAHKHGSTAINVANGMTGAFIIEGEYDDDLNTWYGDGWTRTQPVMVLNQLGNSPNLMGGGAGQIDKGPDFSVNGRLRPTVQMRPGEVQMWRIVNTSGRAGAYFTGPPKGFHWKQLAQDGVQFNDTNYQSHLDKPILLAAGNRADLLVQAPDNCAAPNDCALMVQNEVDPSDLTTASKVTFLTVNISGTKVDPKSNQGQFIPNAPKFPTFLADIKESDVQGTKRLVFASTPPNNPPQTPAMHTIDGNKFDGEVGAVVLLNQTEEWKVVNETYGPPIAHPFHIHINPFQVVEVFSPAAPLIDPKTGKPPINPKTGKPYIDPQTNKVAVKYAFHKDHLAPGQCYLDPDDPESWKPCTPQRKSNLVWWDVFPIPTGYAPTTDAKGNNPLLNKDGQPVQVPGYFKMRSRFVDYSGYYVLHCHILAHEDRGMMTVVEVAPARSPYSHH